ncbi:MAG: hypothetical protein LBB88_05340 [Planctomycetaceae bacterium]|nr:hypothetical protein [Planctomycetaceae bacterium]
MTIVETQCLASLLWFSLNSIKRSSMETQSIASLLTVFVIYQWNNFTGQFVIYQ